MRIVLATALATLALAAPAHAALGDLTFVRCVSSAGSVCAGTDADAASVRDVAVAPDGTSLYTAGLTYAGSSPFQPNSGTVLSYTRSADGTVTRSGCFKQAAASSCTTVPALIGAKAIATAPDGSAVYVAAQGDGTAAHSGALVRFTRASGGLLTYAGCIGTGTSDGCLAGPAAAGVMGGASVTTSPSGDTVYFGGEQTGTLAAFRRAGDGSLTNIGCYVTVAVAGCTTSSKLGNVTSMAVTADGSSLYTAGNWSSTGDGVVGHYLRVADGSLLEGTCYHAGTFPVPACSIVAGMRDASGIAASRDSRNVYVSSSFGQRIASFSRSAAGDLSMTGCVESTGADGCANAGASMFGLSGIVVSRDGATVYAAVDSGNGFTLTRNPSGGALAPVRCQSLFGGAGCAGPVFNGRAGLALSPDEANVYVASGFVGTLFRAALPVVTTGPPDPLIGQTSARVTGTIDPVGLATTGRVEYGPTTAYGATTGSLSAGPGRGPNSFAAVIESVTPATTYHYRLVAENSSGTAFGEDRTFTTAAATSGPGPGPEPGPGPGPDPGPGPAPGPGPGPAPGPAPQAPKVTGFTASPSTFRLGTKPAKASARTPKVKVGTDLKFRLDRAASVKISFIQSLPGRRKGTRCVPDSRKLRALKRCTRLVTVAKTLDVPGRAGANKVHFEGRIDARTTLKPGRYALSLTATADGRRSAAATTKITVVAAAKKKR